MCLPGTIDVDPAQTVVAAPRLEFTDAITVEAWIEADEVRAEAMQVIVAQWSPLGTFDTFEAYDAGHTSGLETAGFFGAVFDGRYVYFVPQHDSQTRHGKVLRYDTHGDFHASTSWEGYDAGRTDGMNTKGYYGAVATGDSIYFVPRRDAEGFHSRVLRYDRQGDFADPRSWEAYDAGMDRSYQSAAFDGRYIYFSPGHVAVHRSEVSEAKACASPAVTGMDPNYVLQGNSIVLRHDTCGGFKDSQSWATYDAADTNGLDTCDYDGACFDGRYIYFAPLSTGNVLRYNTHSSFDDRQSWTAFDAKPLGMKLCVGAVFDGRHIYFVPYGESDILVRYDSDLDFNDPSSWSNYCTSDTAGFPTTGFDGGIFDGRYVYLIPYYDGKDFFHGYVLRYDTQRQFRDARSWDCADSGLTAGLKTVGFNGGAFDGRHIYFAAWLDGTSFPGALVGNGRILRYDTVGHKGSFSLRFVDYGHNGGLNAAVPGIRFLVNTDRGVISISSNKTPEPERHYIVGSYDGITIRLFIDGELVNEQPARGRIVNTDVDLSVGRVLNGLGRFKGRLLHIRISNTVPTAETILARFREQDLLAVETG